MRGRSAAFAMVVVLMAAAGTAQAAVTPKPSDVTDLTLTISSAKLIVETLAPNGVEVSGSDPVLQGKPVQVSGTLTRDNRILRIAPAGFLFPELPIPEDKINFKGVSVDIIQMRQAVGSIDPVSGKVRIPMSLAIQLKAPTLGLRCLIRGFDLTFGTDPVSVGTGAAAPMLRGSVLDKATNSLTLVGAGKIPDASKIPASECDVVSRLVASGLSGKSLGLSITGTSALGSAFRVPAVATATVTRVGFSSKRATVTVSCAGTDAANRGCAGTVSLTVNTSTPFTLTGAWRASAGRSATVSFSLTDAQRSAIRNNRVRGRLTPPTGRLSATVDNGTGVSRTLTSVTSG